MTAIAAIKLNGRIAMAADGGLFHGYEITSRSARKIGHWGSLAIAASGDARTLSVIASDATDWAKEDLTPEKIWQQIRERLTRDGYAWTPADERGAASCGQHFLMIHGKSLYHICGTGHIAEMQEGEPVSIGCAGEPSNGAMDALSKFPDWPAAAIVVRAVEIAKQRSAYAAGGTLLIERGVGEASFAEQWID